MAERTLNDRVDDGILAAAHRLSRLRVIPLRGAVEAVRASSEEGLRDSKGTPDESIWALRISRCDSLLAEPSDAALRSMASGALERDR